MNNLRIGHGYDVHAFCEDKPLILGGITIPHPKGLQGHSDADVVLHAVCDALLGAAVLGDIGQHFPPDDARYANKDSRYFLQCVRVWLADKRFVVNNIDITIIAQVPQLAPHIPSMMEAIQAELHLQQGQVNVKATTTEHLGFIGREEGIAVHVVALIGQNTHD